MNQKIKTTPDPELTRQIATEYALVPSMREVAQKYGVTVGFVQKIVNSDPGAMIIADIREKALGAAVTVLKQGATRLVEKALRVIEDKLDKGDLNAVPLVFKLLGVDGKAEVKEAQQQVLQVILPPGIMPSKEVVSEVQD